MLISLKSLHFEQYDGEVNSKFLFLLDTRLPVTRWVKLSLNFEFLVPK